MIGGQTMALLLEPPSILIPSAALDEYVGTYEVAPKLAYEITRQGEALFGGRSSRTPTALKAEMTDLFFSPSNLRVRKIFLRDRAGKITGFADRREGMDVIWTRRRSG